MAKHKKLVLKTVNLKDAAYAYFSVCHNAIAEKPALTMPQGKGIGRFIGAKPETDNTQGLGGWRCSTCRKPCKVQRTKNDASQDQGSPSSVPQTIQA
jgi:hypothetical protein